MSNRKDTASVVQSSSASSTVHSDREEAGAIQTRFPRVLEDENGMPYLDPSFTPNQNQTQNQTQNQDENQVEPRHCWICLEDEGECEDTADISEWRSACKCKLQAHEECLLQWMTELEAQNNASLLDTEIRCPQCQGEIQVARPRDHIVLAVDIVRNVLGLFFVPAQISAVIGCLASGSLVYGLNAVHVFFGTEDTMKLLGSETLEQYSSGWLDKLLPAMPYMSPLWPSNCLVGWGPFALALPLVAPILALSRARFSGFTSIILPLPYLLYRVEYGDLKRWPPSPDLAFAVLPYIRFAYFEVYKRMLLDLERKWDRALLRKPKKGETMEQVAREQLERDREGRGDVIINLEIVVDGEHEDQEVQAIPNALQAPAQDLADHAQVNGPNGEIVRQPVLNGVQPEAQAGTEWFQDTSMYGLATSLMGALFFPAISSLMGGLLKVTLPKSWVRIPVVRIPVYNAFYFWSQKNSQLDIGARGLLQEKWGRSMVGGCLFIVLKDAVILYYKWRRAQIHQKRRVLDYAQREPHGVWGRIMGNNGFA